jgi:tartrate/fumarate subfamily iron-sulfur-dependent hydro-lyase beta chain
MSREFKLQLPTDEKTIRELRVGDVVYLSGLLCTLRDMGHRRAVDALARGEQLPFDLSTCAMWHSGPIAKQEGGRWRIVSAGPTTSSRFTPLGAQLIRDLGIRVVIGKGTMGPEAREAMREVGACFLNSTGGAAVLYAQQVEEVEAVHWLDLGEPEAAWVVRVREMGPLVVGIDSHGDSLHGRMKVRTAPALAQVYERSGISPGDKFVYLPKRVPAGGQPSPS